MNRRRMRRITRDLRLAGGDELVTGAYLLDRAAENHCSGLPRSGPLRRAEIDRLVGESLVGVGVDERAAFTIDVPDVVFRFAHAAHVSRISRSENDAISLGADDGGRLIEPVGLDHKRPAEEGLDD